MSDRFSTRLDAALTFAELGCRVVPAIGKNPGKILGQEWPKHATRDRELIRFWFRRHPHANVGILGDRALLPLDVDDPASFQRLQAETVAAPDTPRYWTRGAPGRERLLFAYPGDEALARADRRLADGVQLRHSNASALMCLVPPSVHPETRLEQDWRITLDDAPLARIPREWLERVQPANGPRKPTGYWPRLFKRHYPTGCGDTHPDVVAMAGWLLRRTGSPVITRELMVAWTRAHTHPEKPEKEVLQIVADLARKEVGRQ
jgi:hypothetical protein